MLKFFPLPNQPGNAVTGAQNYFATGTAELNVDNLDGRVDHQISDRQKGFMRYSYRKTFSAPAVFFPADIAVAEGRVNEQNLAHNAVFDYNRTVSNTTVMSARFGFARTLFIFDNQGLGFKPSSLGLPASIDANVDREMFPRFGVGGMVTLGGNDHRYNAFMSYTAAAGLTKVRGGHSLKTGFEGRMLRVNVWEARSAGTFNFRTNETQGPVPTTASSTAGFGFASFLLGFGQPNDVLIQNWKNVAANSFYWAGYAQDDWRVNSRLTLNLGVRYDIDVPRTERFNRMNYFDPVARSPLARSGAGVSRSQRRRGLRRRRWTEPLSVPTGTRTTSRRGSAGRYQLDQKTVIRGGYSHIFGPSNQGAQGTVGPFGFRTENLWVTSIDGITPLNLLRNPYPNGFVPSPGSSQGLLTQAGANLQAPLQDTPSPWTIQYNVNVQRELPWAMFLEVAYVGTRGYDLSTVGEGGPQPEPARSPVHVARHPAQSAGPQPVLRHRQQRRADAADRGPRPAAAPVSAVHRRHSALCVRREVALPRLADDRPQAVLAWVDVRRLVHLRAVPGNRDEPPGQLQPRRQLGARLVRHQAPVRRQLSLRAALRTQPPVRFAAPRRCSTR